MSGRAPRGRVALLLVATFAAGAAAGVAADRQIRRPAEAAAGPGSDASRERGYTIERFADDLGLTAEQRAAIAPILEDTRSRMRDLSHRVRPEYRQIVDSARARIEAVLTPDQVASYRELLERERRRDRDDGDDGHDGRDASASPDPSASDGDG